MRYTVLNSSEPVRFAGLPFSVALIEPRQVIAAFDKEATAVALCKHLNAQVEADDRPVIKATDSGSGINVNKPLFQQRLDALKNK
jgi:hypothetical protein